MKTLKFKNREDWLAARRGKITGTRLGGLIVKRGTEKKITFFDLIAERVGVASDPDENAMERGSRMESEAMERFKKETGKKLDTTLLMWARDDNESMAVSPDGILSATEAVECKCLSSGRHLEAYIKKYIWNRTDWEAVPNDYKDQILQYFIVNDKLKTMHVAFYDPRIPVKDFFTLKVSRKDVAELVDEYKAYELATLKEIDEIVNILTF